VSTHDAQHVASLVDRGGDGDAKGKCSVTGEAIGYRAKRTSIAMVFGVVVGLILTSWAQAQPGGRRQGGPGGGPGRGGRAGQHFGDMMYFESTWSAVAFQCDASKVQLGKIRPTFQKTYDSRKAAMEKARQNRDFQAVQTAMKTIKQSIEAKLKEVLLADQKAKLTKWQQSVQTRAQKLMSQAQGQGQQGNRQAMSQSFYLDRTWSLVAFDLEVTNEQLFNLRTTYDAQWTKREQALNSGNLKTVTTAMTQIKSSLDASLKKVLSSAQWTKLQQAMAPRARPQQGNR